MSDRSASLALEMARRSRQQELSFRTHGGARANAGRKRRAARPLVPHRTRPFLDGRTPVHITLRMLPTASNLRRRDQHRAIRTAMARTCERDGFRICQYTVQANHVHLIAEPCSREALTSGMIAFKTSCAHRLNRSFERRGRVFADRYHARPLRTPREVRNALVYVLNNWRRHGEDRAHRDWRTDRFSSADVFDGWTRPADWRRPPGPPTVAPAELWLTDEGWRRHGAIDPAEVPGVSS